MSKKSRPFLAHSEITDCIYIIDGNDKYEVTEQCISAMKATNRMPNVLDKIRAEIKDWQTDIHDNEYDAEKHDFVFERIYEIIDTYKAEGSEE